MAVKTREEFLTQLNELIGESTDDAALSIIEDFTDTYDSLNKSDEEDWKKRYEENDKEWREKYKNRFFNGSNQDDTKNPEEDTDDNDTNTELSFEELFKQKER